MKKKFVLTLALVLIVAVGLSAATPIEVSGSFTAGYEFKFASPNAFKADNDSHVSTVVDFTGDFWKISVDAGGPLLADEDGVTATAELYLDKALAAEGIDMGDVALTLHVGDGVSTSAPTLLADKNDFRDDDGSELAMNASDNFGITLGYAEMVEVYFSVDPTNSDIPMVVGATVTPLDGLSVALGFTNDYTAAANNGLVVSAMADVAKLAGLDFDLAVTGEFIMDLDNETNVITADAATSIEGIGLWVAYFKNALDVNALAAKVSYETTIEKFTVGASVMAQMDDLSDIAGTDEYTIAAFGKYAMGGATYKVEAQYEVTAEAFTLSPSVTIAF